MAGTLNDEISRVQNAVPFPGGIDTQLWNYWNYKALGQMPVTSSQADRFRNYLGEKCTGLSAAQKATMSQADLQMYWQRTVLGTSGAAINELMRNWWITQ